MGRDIYILSAKQISAQQPLVDDWIENPLLYSEAYVRAIDPDFKQYLAPNVARRLGRILKRALLVSQKTMEESGIKIPDAIITGTGLGCIENTEVFLDKLVREGEEFLNPTYFMQSTHNTISSLVAIDAKCHGYNSTYAHREISFECALQDAFLQLKNDKIENALVGAHDEMTPDYFTLLKKAGFLGQTGQTFAGETAVAMMLSTGKNEKALCKVESVEKTYLRFEDLDIAKDINFVMIGVNGSSKNDLPYFENCKKFFPNIPLLQYKNIFGESYTASALGVYAAALCLQKGKIPASLIMDQNTKEKYSEKPRKILCYNQSGNKNHTFIVLSTC